MLGTQVHSEPPQQQSRLEPGTPAVERREKLSYRTFIEEYMGPNRPVLVTDAIDHWAALGKWTPDYFRKRYAEMDLELDGLTMAEFIDRVERSALDVVENLPYLRNKSIHQHFRELEPDILPLPVYLQPNWFNNPLVPSRISRHRTDLFIGGRGCGFPYLHYDNYHGYAFICQVYGEKEFVLIPPEQTAYVYPSATSKGIANASSIPDIDHPDLEQFPLFAKTTPARLVLRSGDMLFVPAGWWHTARMHGPSISISSNTANAFNWGRLMSDHWKTFHNNPIRAIAGIPYLRTIWLWESLRDQLYRNRRLSSREPVH